MVDKSKVTDTRMDESSGRSDHQIVLKDCAMPHMTTLNCSCPEQLIPRPMLLPQPREERDNAIGLDVRAVVFCAPVETSVHILDTETEACFNPLGAHLSCDCVVFGPSVAVPIAYVNITTNAMRSGLLRFCSAAEEDVVLSTGVTVATVVIAAVTGAAAAGSAVQNSVALSMAACGESSASNSDHGALVPFSIGSDRLTSGIFALVSVVFGLMLLQGCLVLSVWLGRRWCGVLKEGDLHQVAGQLRFPAVALMLSLLVVQGAIIAAGRLLVESDGFGHFVLGVLSMSAVVGSGLGLLWWGRQLPVATKSLNFVWYGMRTCHGIPSTIHRLIPLGCFKCDKPLWRMWGLVYSASREGMVGWDPTESFLISLQVGCSATISALSLVVCRVLGTATALVCMLNIVGYLWWRPHRRPTQTVCIGVMRAVSMVLALRSTWFNSVDDEPFTYVLVGVALLLGISNCGWFLLERKWNLQLTDADNVICATAKGCFTVNTSRESVCDDDDDLIIGAETVFDFLSGQETASFDLSFPGSLSLASDECESDDVAVAVDMLMTTMT